MKNFLQFLIKKQVGGPLLSVAAVLMGGQLDANRVADLSLLEFKQGAELNRSIFCSNSCDPCKPACEPCKPACEPCKPVCDPCDPCKPACDPCCHPTWTVAFRAAAFLPLTSQHRDLYGTALPSIGFQLGWSFWDNICCSCDFLRLYFETDWVFKEGETKGFGYCTDLDLIPLTLGLEYNFNFCNCFDFFVGLGPHYTFLRVDNFDGFIEEKHKEGDWGVMTKTGFRWNAFCNFYLDVFADYYYVKFKKISDPIVTIDREFSAFFVGASIGTCW